MTRLGWLALVLVAACVGGSHVTYAPRDVSLRHAPLYFYPAPARPAKAFVFFLGNDIGFWKPHEELARRLASDGYDVVGLDDRKFLATLPEAEPARDSSFGASIDVLMARARAELGDDSLPVIVGGHSSGAEVALWIAAHRAPRHLVGVLAMSPRSTGHLFVTALDVLNHEASGRWSFSTIGAVRQTAPTVRIALVRGGHDPFRRYDSAFAVAGGRRLRHYDVPLAGHSLRKLVIAGPIVEHAMSFLLEDEGERRPVRRSATRSGA